MSEFDIERQIKAIAIGASAGGVEALSVLLPRLPNNLPVSLFIVLHLPRDRPSHLVDIFSHRCELPVKEAEDKELIKPGVVYFAPPGYHLLLDEGPQFALSIDELVNFSRPSIDVLFESAADVYREHLAGVILTGGNADGALGLAAIHRFGGLTIVQQPATAQNSMMPMAALEKSPVDFQLSLEEIADFFCTLS